MDKRANGEGDTVDSWIKLCRPFVTSNSETYLGWRVVDYPCIVGREASQTWLRSRLELGTWSVIAACYFRMRVRVSGRCKDASRSNQENSDSREKPYEEMRPVVQWKGLGIGQTAP